MSAFMVNREHIRFLVSATQDKRIVPGLFSYSFNEESIQVTGDRDELSRIGQVLWDANLQSIHARYPESIGRPDRVPGPNNETFIYAHSAGWPAPLKSIDVLKAIAGLQYQSCEFKDWEKSEAFAILKSLEKLVVRTLQGKDIHGYDDAPWVIGPEELRAAMDARMD